MQIILSEFLTTLNQQCTRQGKTIVKTIQMETVRIIHIEIRKHTEEFKIGILDFRKS
jgi:hypothetical protein